MRIEGRRQSCTYFATWLRIRKSIVRDMYVVTLRILRLGLFLGYHDSPLWNLPWDVGRGYGAGASSWGMDMTSYRNRVMQLQRHVLMHPDLSVRKQVTRQHLV